MSIALLALLSASLLAICAPSASAVIVRLSTGKRLSYQPLPGASALGPAGVKPFDSLFSNLEYNGGPVMTSNTNYAFYWAPSGTPAYPSDYQPGVNRFFVDLEKDSGGHENTDSVATQYNDAAGGFANYSSHFGGALIDTHPYPAKGCSAATRCLTDEQIQAELKRYVAENGLPHDLSHEYFVLTPPTVEDCFEASSTECSVGSSSPVYCAYHGNVPLSEGEIIYANDPYVTGVVGPEGAYCDEGIHPNGTSSDGVLAGGLVHEHTESTTDPEPNNAWTEVAPEGAEIGDKCGYVFGSMLGSTAYGEYNQVINKHYYFYQEEWSNQGHECLQRLTFAGTEPTATFTATATTGATVSFNATGSTAPGGVSRYSWQFNDGPGLSNPVESSSPTISHKFPSEGIYTVALTVFASDGTSIGTARTVLATAVSVKKISPKTGPAIGGTHVTITGTGLSAVTAVSFGSVGAEFKINSSTSITATSPPDTTGKAAVTVTTPQGPTPPKTSTTFKYQSPTVTGVSPASGSVAGGKLVKISGSGFAVGKSTTTFLFGKVAALSVECESSTSCSATTPAAAKAATVAVVASVAAVKSKKAPADRFTYE